MPRPRFSEVLVSRRHELGLSVSQASRTLKLREDVLIAFEEGDFERMPQSGYAQGMLSSYARYLGLNARELVDLFQEELYQHQHGTSSHELRRRTRQTQSGRGVTGYDVPNEASSRPKAYVEYRPLLPTGGGPAGDMGDFATTAMARPRNSVPLAGVGAPAPGTRGFRGSSARSYGDDRDARRYNASDPRERQMPSTARRRAAGQRRRSDDGSGRLIDERQQRSYTAAGRTMGSPDRLYRRDDVSTRRVRPHEYTDDMRMDDEANPYAPASTISGRRSSRNIANVERPNVRRRPARARQQSSGSRGGRHGGLVGYVGQFLADPRRALFVIVVLLAIVLTAILTFSVSSCVSAKNQPSTGQVVPVGTADQDDAEQNATTDDDATADDSTSDDAAADDADASASDEEPKEGENGAEGAEGDAADEKPKETIVEVSVASGEVSWIEITCDGSSVIADSVSGPWSESYTVHDSITIQVAEPDVVTVKENGEEVDFTSHAGGLGSVTIEGTPAPEEEAEGKDGTEAEQGEGESTPESTA